MKNLFLTFLVAVMSGPISAQFYKKDQPFAHTYSIVARDTVTGEMGVAVQSHWFSVGTGVTWGKSGVGVVATQSFTNPSFGPRGLQLLENGLTAELAVNALIEVDEARGVRQLAILDANGNVAAHTGKDCIEAAGHYVGNNFSVQANLMEKATVWPAMAKAFEETKGSLAERMLAALEAAQAEGGDIRGKQSAALMVVGKEDTGNEWDDKLVDLRVDDHETPLKELRRLLTVQQAYEFMNAGDVAVEKGDIKGAKEMYQKAQQLNPDNIEMKYWYAVTLVNNKEFAEAKSIFKKVFDKDKNWQALLKRLKKVNLLQVTESQLKELERL
ncbi:DUF1028 domain-containing protein [Flavobacteriaceae bacterium R38]|nr:DUF1028 domain-containing protein [Flavobacteriaceae bacterium R38]